MKKIALYVASSFFFFHGFSENISETKEARVQLTYKDGQDIIIKGRETYLEIDSWDENRVEILAKVEFKGKENNRVREFLDNFEYLVKGQISENSSEITINADHDEPNKVQIGSKFIGVQIDYNEEDLEISYLVKLPRKARLYIKNSYDVVSFMANHDGDVEMELYSGRLRAKELGNVRLNLKYGSADISAVNSLDSELYEQELNIDYLDEARIETKYSRLELGKIAGELTLESYESRILLNDVSSLTGGLKYGSIKVEGTVTNIDLRSIYELEMSLGVSGVVEIQESKYSNFDINEVSKLILSESYEDNLDVTKLGEFYAKSKYTDYDIQFLQGDFRLDESYEGEVKVYNLENSVSNVFLNGKYVNANFGIGQRPFKLIADIQYGNVSYPKDDQQRQMYVRDGEKLEIESNTSNFKTGDLLIEIIGYEVEADIVY